MYTGRSNCYQCPKNMVKQCELEFGTDGIPPCTKAVVENFNSLQQLQAKIAALADELTCIEVIEDDVEKGEDIIRRLRQLSAMQ